MATRRIALVRIDATDTTPSAIALEVDGDTGPISICDTEGSKPVTPEIEETVDRLITLALKEYK